MYDESCETLARHFIEDPATTEDEIKSLAQHIQNAVEDWISDHEQEKPVIAEPNETKSAGRRGLQKLLKSLGLAPIRTCVIYPHVCCLCNCNITLGQQYRDRGYGKRAHVDCLTAVANELS